MENHPEKPWHKIKTQSLTGIALENIRSRILTGELKPGQRLNESEIAAGMGISRSPVRESMRILEKEGLITTVSHKGSYIRDVSIRDMEELFRLREILECYAIDAVKKRAIQSPNKVTAQIDNLMETIEKKYDPINVISGFHYGLVELSNNYRLIELYRTLAVSLRRYWLIYHSRKIQRNISLEHHRTVIRMLSEGNYTYAKKMLKTHIRYVKKIVKKQVKQILES